MNYRAFAVRLLSNSRAFERLPVVANAQSARNRGGGKEKARRVVSRVVGESNDRMIRILHAIDVNDNLIKQ
jgi:hypothetical protein